ncbi:ABC transporter permease subunit [Halobacterium sp. KA-6]|uniref:ABC transporter permease subunit n=1 Tax=Halobacterium sp. KA-6 TaxID=2896368 RepID=UPI001E2AE6F7|nr:ABC transporter permease subunit [Halobacterium sp. KA-6]MCD2204833.1 ABC transporter permease [Halobacterium sp. KA-6]
MFEIAAYGARKRVKGALALSVGLSAFSAMYAAFFPSLTGNLDLEEYIKALPPVFVEAFGLRAFNTIEGFLATELYQFAWVILLGLYLAYSAASLISGDVESGRMDVLLSLPVSRARLVGERFLSLVPGVLLINVVVAAVTWVATRAIGYPIGTVDLVAVHLLSLPYLFACAAIGLAFGVLADRESIAQRAAMATVFGLFLLESLLASTDYAWAGAVAPMRYFDPTAILVDGTYDVAGAVILVAATLLLVAGSQLYFRQKDVN